jgi:DNA-binding response OmpR family regulator
MGQQLVLVVEDDHRYRDLIGLILTHGGYRTLFAPDGRTGLALLAQEAPDLVLLDLMLPDVAGPQLYQLIRQQSRVPILVLTAADHLIPGSNQLAKPFGAEELLARVGATLRTTNRHAQGP